MAIETTRLSLSVIHDSLHLVNVNHSNASTIILVLFNYFIISSLFLSLPCFIFALAVLTF